MREWEAKQQDERLHGRSPLQTWVCCHVMCGKNLGAGLVMSAVQSGQRGVGWGA